MRLVWTTVEIDAPAEAVWNVFTDVDRWADWGPTVRSAALDGGGPLEQGATGRITTLGGLTVAFEITYFVAPIEWSWKVAGIPATRHRVEHLGPQRSRAGFGLVPAAAPYLAVCRVALGRIREMARAGG